MVVLNCAASFGAAGAPEAGLSAATQIHPAIAAARHAYRTLIIKIVSVIGPRINVGDPWHIELHPRTVLNTIACNCSCPSVSASRGIPPASWAAECWFHYVDRDAGVPPVPDAYECEIP